MTQVNFFKKNVKVIENIGDEIRAALADFQTKTGIVPMAVALGPLEYVSLMHWRKLAGLVPPDSVDTISTVLGIPCYVQAKPGINFLSNFYQMAMQIVPGEVINE